MSDDPVTGSPEVDLRALAHLADALEPETEPEQEPDSGCLMWVLFALGAVAMCLLSGWLGARQ